MFHMPSFYVGLGTGAFVLAILLAFVLPDKWATWFVLRKNAPKWLLIPAVGAFALGLAILAFGYGSAIATILARVHFENWVIVVYWIGVVLIVFCVLLILLGRRRNEQETSRS